MSKNKTQNSKFQSKYGELYCTAKQYICEVLMERKYNKKRIRLPAFFWNEDLYKKEYQKQIIRINQLIKLYNEEIVINTVINNKWLYSLYFPRIDSLMETEEKKLQSQESKIESYIEPEPSANSKTRPGSKKVIGTFRKLD